MNLDQELRDIILEKIQKTGSKVFVVSCGLTSSHLGDERNLREFLLASEIVEYVKSLGHNVNFYLFNDSSDALTFAQLRVGVNKDEKLIKGFEGECGKPIKLVRDPFNCHENYSDHFISEIMDRFHKLGIYPTVIDVWSLYNNGMFDEAKTTILSKYNEVQTFLNKRFPGYHMKNIFWPLCPYCQRINTTEVKKVTDQKLTFYCAECKKQKTYKFSELKGKFGWKIDTAIKWNLFNTDFEPYTTAYLDPNVGSYYIAKAMSQEFFNGAYPEPVNIGSITFDRSLSYQLMPSLPEPVFRILFLENRKKDISITHKKILSASMKHKITDQMSYYDYVRMKLPYDVLEQGDEGLEHLSKFGNHFSKLFFQQNLKPQLPTEMQIKGLSKIEKDKIINLLQWIVVQKQKNPDGTHEEFLNSLNRTLIRFKIKREETFPILRDLISMEHGIPLSRIFYFMPETFVHQLLHILTRKGLSKENNHYSVAHG